MNKAELIKQATERSYNDWTNYTRTQELHIHLIFKDAADDITRQIARYESKGLIPPTRLVTLLDMIKSEMATLRPKLSRSIKQGMKNSVDYGLKTSILSANSIKLPGNYNIQLGTSFIGKDGVVRRYDASKEVYNVSMWAQINGDAMDALLRYKPTGLTFSDRIWDITYQSQKIILNQVTTAVATGSSPAKLSREIRRLLAIPDTFRGDVLKTYQPGQGIYKSAYKNAMRLTRTELARAYTEGTIRYAKQKNWIDGWIWRVGGGNPCPDCSDLDSRYFPKDEPPDLPLHPQCMCYLELHIEERALAA